MQSDTPIYVIFLRALSRNSRLLRCFCCGIWIWLDSLLRIEFIHFSFLSLGCFFSIICNVYIKLNLIVRKYFAKSRGCDLLKGNRRRSSKNMFVHAISDYYILFFHALGCSIHLLLNLRQNNKITESFELLLEFVNKLWDDVLSYFSQRLMWEQIHMTLRTLVIIISLPFKHPERVEIIDLKIIVEIIFNFFIHFIALGCCCWIKNTEVMLKLFHRSFLA